MDKKRSLEIEDSVDIDEEEARRLKKLKKKEKKRLLKLQKQAEEGEQGEDEENIETVEDQMEETNNTSLSEQQSQDELNAKKEAKRLKKLAKLQQSEVSTDNKPINVNSSAEAESFRSEHGIQVFPEEDAATFAPITSFSNLYPKLEKDCPYLLDYLKKKAFTTPSPIQAQCWPPLLAGRDVIGIASTGSGKTLAFLIPAMLKIAKRGKFLLSKGSTPTPRVLIVSPTRELAAQSHDVAVEIGGPLSVCIYGGVPKHSQKQELRNGADIVVATPGRLLDLIEEGALNLSAVTVLVLDEADRMLDEGFEPVIRKIISSCPVTGPGPNDRQTVMFSATWPEEIRELAASFMSPNSVRVVVGSTELSANHRVTQIVECIESFDKNKRLFALLDSYHKSRTNKLLIFVLYKREAVTLLSVLQGRGLKVTAIHGDRSQQERTAALETFKTGENPLLIATDVAARGLDIPKVEYVINYSFPLTVEDYVHRIGRTGRGGATGISHTFFCDSDKTLAGALVAVLQEAGQAVPQEIFKYSMVTKKKTSKLYGDFGPKAELAGKKATKITFDD